MILSIVYLSYEKVTKLHLITSLPSSHSFFISYTPRTVSRRLNLNNERLNSCTVLLCFIIVVMYCCLCCSVCFLCCTLVLSRCVFYVSGRRTMATSGSRTEAASSALCDCGIAQCNVACVYSKMHAPADLLH